MEGDLFFASRIISVLEKAGHTVKAVRTREAAETEIAADRPDLVILNLASPALGRADLIRHVKSASPGTRVIAFLSHMKLPEVRDEMIAAGVDRLCANSAITMRLPDIVRDTVAGSGAGSGVVEED